MKNVVKEYKLKYEPTQREATILRDSRDTSEELRKIFDPDTIGLFESFFALYLNQSNKVKGFLKIGQGGMTQTVADPRLLLMGALDSLSTAVVIAHNHPSGNPRPSEDDRRLTQKIREACKLLDIVLIDHIILGDGSYYSFRDHGELI